MRLDDWANEFDSLIGKTSNKPAKNTDIITYTEEEEDDEEERAIGEFVEWLLTTCEKQTPKTVGELRDMIQTLYDTPQKLTPAQRWWAAMWLKHNFRYIEDLYDFLKVSCII